jgi:hypothetical protein
VMPGWQDWLIGIPVLIFLILLFVLEVADR